MPEKPTFTTARRPIIKPSVAGSNNVRWKGGEIVTKDGRVMIHSPLHPHQSKGRYVYRYRLNMEKKIGRYLDPSEIVHHINGIKNDDRIENLELMTNYEHSKMHGDAMIGGRWSYKHDKCVQCGTTEAEHSGHGKCTRCADRARWKKRPKKTK